MKGIVSIAVSMGDAYTLTEIVGFDPEDVDPQDTLDEAVVSMKAKIAGYEAANE